MEKQPFEDVSPIYSVMFHCHICLLEGTLSKNQGLEYDHGHGRIRKNLN